jgi:hypothetical protein
MTRAELVQKLLDENKITAAEAVVLLTPEDSYTRPTTYLPYQPQRGTDPYWFTTSTHDNA